MGPISIAYRVHIPLETSPTSSAWSADMASYTTIAFICKFRFPTSFFVFTHEVLSNDSNNGCPECQGKLIAANNDQKIIQFRPRDEFGEENLKLQITAINQSLAELKNVMITQNCEHIKMTQVIE